MCNIKQFLNAIITQYRRIAIFLCIRGIKIPGVHAIKKQMDFAAYQKFERQKLIHDIKGGRFIVRVGPLWFRVFLEKCIGFLQKNKFIILIFSKVTISVVCISIPIALFVLLRGVLPVPERVPYEKPQITLKSISNVHVDFPYTSPEDVLTQNKEIYKQPEGLKQFGIGFYPVKLTVMRGFTVSEMNELVVKKIQSVDNTRTSETTNDTPSQLRIGYYLFPSPSSKQQSCVLQVFNSQNELLVQATNITPNVESYSKYSIRNSWRIAFTPNVIPNYGRIEEFKIPISAPPDEIRIKTFNSTPSGESLSEPQCVFVVSDFSFEHPVKKPLPRRGVIFIVVDTLRANTAYDSRIMPKLNRYMQNGGLTFLEHRAQSNSTFSSMSSLLTSRYPSEFNLLSSEPTPLLPLAIQNLGYRVGGIGLMSPFTNVITNGVDMGFHNAIIAEHVRYDGRHITEMAGQWLEKYGNAPFFLYLHYNTMNRPYKPPFENLNLSELSQNPFGLRQKRELYAGVARYLDGEVQMLFQKLKDLGIFDQVDIVFTSDYGAQLENKEWGIFAGVERKLKGGYTDKGHTLFDEEIRVPLMMKIAGRTFEAKSTVTNPTAHLDLFPTLYHLMGGDPSILHARGLDFSESLFSKHVNSSMDDIFSRRHFLFMEANRYTGVLAWDTENLQSPTKYIRQKESDAVTIFLTRTPWKKDISWFQPELYSKVDFNKHTEQWFGQLSADEVDRMREIFNENYWKMETK